MKIKPFKAICQNNHKISGSFEETSKSFFLTDNNKNTLETVDEKTFEHRTKMLKLREELLTVEEDRIRGEKGYSVSEVAEMMQKAIEKTLEDPNKYQIF